MRLTLLDAADVVLCRRNPLTPSRRAIEYIGGSDFAEVGQHLAGITIDVGGLRSHEHVLDIGCGYGRIAVPLTRYLDSGGYDGFDISRRAIRWCRAHIAERFPNFRFTHVDVRNGHYNPGGRVDPAEFVFPCVDSSVDVVVAASVFTHLTREAARRYISESSRVLRSGGRCIASFYILDSESLEKIRTVRTEPAFRILDGSSAVQRTEDPEAAIALSEELVRTMFIESGLQVSAIHRGGWRQRAGVSYQDFVLAMKP